MEQEPITGREILLTLAIKYNGEWEKIYHAIKVKENLSREEIKSSKEKIKSNFVTIIDEDYPNWLKQISSPPFVLFYYGDLSRIDDGSKNITIVGNKRPSNYAADIIKKITKDLANKLAIVSGINNETNALILKNSIFNENATIGVQCCGIDYIYPKENFEIYNKLKEKGLIISEYPNEYFPEKTKIPFCNRIIAGVSKMVLVIEENEKNTINFIVNYALDFGKEVGAIPHDINDGDILCNQIIKSGGMLVNDAKDILEAYSLE